MKCLPFSHCWGLWKYSHKLTLKHGKAMQQRKCVRCGKTIKAKI